MAIKSGVSRSIMSMAIPPPHEKWFFEKLLTKFAVINIHLVPFRRLATTLHTICNKISFDLHPRLAARPFRSNLDWYGARRVKNLLLWFLLFNPFQMCVWLSFCMNLFLFKQNEDEQTYVWWESLGIRRRRWRWRRKKRLFLNESIENNQSLINFKSVCGFW